MPQRQRPGDDEGIQLRPAMILDILYMAFGVVVLFYGGLAIAAWTVGLFRAAVWGLAAGLQWLNRKVNG